jgi:hypothetical protein
MAFKLFGNYRSAQMETVQTHQAEFIRGVLATWSWERAIGSIVAVTASWVLMKPVIIHVLCTTSLWLKCLTQVFSAHMRK